MLHVGTTNDVITEETKYKMHNIKEDILRRLEPPENAIQTTFNNYDAFPCQGVLTIDR